VRDLSQRASSNTRGRCHQRPWLKSLGLSDGGRGRKRNANGTILNPGTANQFRDLFCRPLAIDDWTLARRMAAIPTKPQSVQRGLSRFLKVAASGFGRQTTSPAATREAPARSRTEDPDNRVKYLERLGGDRFKTRASEPQPPSDRAATPPRSGRDDRCGRGLAPPGKMNP